MTHRLIAAEVARGIVIDFEGGTDKSPILLGIHDPEAGLEQLVLEPAFTPAAEHSGLTVETTASAIGRLIERAEAEDRWLIGWSRHEIEIVRRECPLELAARFEACYVDAKIVAKPARHRSGATLRTAGPRSTTNALSHYLALVKFAVPPVHGPGRTGKTIGKLSTSFGRHGQWDRLSGRQKARWSNLLGHNRADCEGTRAVAAWATAILERPRDIGA